MVLVVVVEELEGLSAKYVFLYFTLVKSCISDKSINCVSP
jgi:hypothetical protein